MGLLLELEKRQVLVWKDLLFDRTMIPEGKSLVDLK